VKLSGLAALRRVPENGLPGEKVSTGGLLPVEIPLAAERLKAGLRGALVRWTRARLFVSPRRVKWMTMRHGMAYMGQRSYMRPKGA